MTNWSALSRWTPAYLKAKYGQVEVEIQADRSSNRTYKIDVEKHKKQVLLREFVDMIVNQGLTNDYYLVANNSALDRQELRSLLEDIDAFPDYIDSLDREGKMFFWFGPSGTVTPLHHDPCNLMLAQFYGRKLWRLISPNQTHLLYNYKGVFSDVDCENPHYDEHPLFRNVNIIEVILEPGEIIFVPVGWWHHVKSLDVSISLSFTNFVFPNTYDWQYPNIQR